MPNSRSVYRPEPYWTINSGLNNSRLHKLYSMFFDKQTAFYIGQDVDVMQHDLLKNTYGFKSKKNKQSIFLFKPNGDYRAVYSVDGGSAPNTGFVEQKLINCLIEIGSFCKKNNESATFVIPFVEMPDRVDKGVQHQVLLTVHYDAVNKKLTSTVHDSIGRDSHLDSLADFLKGRHRSTCNDILSQTLKETFKTNSGISVDDVRRIAYNCHSAPEFWISSFPPLLTKIEAFTRKRESITGCE